MPADPHRSLLRHTGKAPCPIHLRPRQRPIRGCSYASAPMRTMTSRTRSWGRLPLLCYECAGP